MGAPELPGDLGDDNLQPVQPIQHPILAGEDNSDNEGMDVYAYQPLPMGDDQDMESVDNNFSDDENEVDLNTVNSVTVPNIESSDDPVAPADANMPAIESADVEIERQVWSEPRPQELQIELDSTRTTQILNAMANFTLPDVAVPEWATGVPEERWKDELLQRIRQRKEPPSGNGNV